jgi:hypothetical protein
MFGSTGIAEKQIPYGDDNKKSKGAIQVWVAPFQLNKEEKE